VYGDTLVPKPFDIYPKLSSWVEKQRHLHRTDRLSEDRVQKLQSLDFAFDAAKQQLDERWEYMFAKLQQYKKKKGDVKVPRHYKEDPQLGRWVGRNRHRGRTGVLEPDRKERLTALGFWWGDKEDRYNWENGIELLKQFHQEHGHALVPMDDKKDFLGRWVKYQRLRDKSNMISEEERKELDDLGFVWEPVPDVVAVATASATGSTAATKTEDEVDAEGDKKPAAVEVVAALKPETADNVADTKPDDDSKPEAAAASNAEADTEVDDEKPAPGEEVSIEV